MINGIVPAVYIYCIYNSKQSSPHDLAEANVCIAYGIYTADGTSRRPTEFWARNSYWYSSGGVFTIKKTFIDWISL